MVKRDICCAVNKVFKVLDDTEWVVDQLVNKKKSMTTLATEVGCHRGSIDWIVKNRFTKEQQRQVPKDKRGPKTSKNLLLAFSLAFFFNCLPSQANVLHTIGSRTAHVIKKVAVLPLYVTVGVYDGLLFWWVIGGEEDKYIQTLSDMFDVREDG